jgi:UDP-MurNAc hydroxylase
MTVACTPTVTFLNHSSVLVSDGSTRILCDPWFEGSAFQNGWRLLHENSHRINELEFDHAWISHEHPDHFSVPTLRQLQGRRSFIFQATHDRKVAQWLGRQHEVTEMADRQVRRFGDIETRLFVCDGYDSAMRFRFADGSTFVNVNDARVELDGVLDALRADAQYADLVACQFSYANYAGNTGDTQIPRDQHESVLARVRTIAQALQPRAVLLFASYVYFSHQENFYWNQHFWLQDMVQALQAQGIRAIVPMPDQCLPLHGLDDDQALAESNRRAIAFWTERHHAARPVDAEHQRVEMSQLQADYQAFRTRLWADNDLALARQGCPQDLRLRVRLADHDTVVELGLLDEHFACSAGRSGHDVEVSSNTLKFLFEQKFARGTVSINSRIQFHYPTAHRFFIFFFIHYANNIGRYFRAGGLSWASLRSIANVAVVQSILKFHPECRRQMDEDLARLGVAASTTPAN